MVLKKSKNEKNKTKPICRICYGEDTNDDIEMKDETEEKKEPKKIRKIRKVKVTRQYMDEKGYLVTKDEEVEEEYWSDEKPEKKIMF